MGIVELIKDLLTAAVITVPVGSLDQCFKFNVQP